MATRMKDIAHDLGLSVVTISKVLRNHVDISEATRQRVLARMKELNYQPNYAARALVTGRSMSIGLIVPDLVHPFFAEVAKGLSESIRKQGYGLLIASSEEDPELERREIEQMLARSVDAVVIASAQLSGESFRAIEERKTPYVLLDRRVEGLSSNFVGVDDVAMGELATEHLISVGCERIAHIRGPRLSTAAGRFTGYARTLERRGMKLPAEYVVVEDTSDVAGDISGYKAMLQLLKVKPRPDGVFCYNDPAAMGAMQAIIEAGLNIPRDIAVIGCGNVFYSQFLRVPLSSMDQGSFNVGEKAGKLVLSLIASKAQQKARTILLETKVVARESTLSAGRHT